MTKSLIIGIKRHLWHKTYPCKRERFFKDFVSPKVKIMPPASFDQLHSLEAQC